MIMMMMMMIIIIIIIIITKLAYSVKQSVAVHDVSGRVKETSC
jgi:hypothetical protein